MVQRKKIPSCCQHGQAAGTKRSGPERPETGPAALGATRPLPNCLRPGYSFPPVPVNGESVRFEALGDLVPTGIPGVEPAFSGQTGQVWKGIAQRGDADGALGLGRDCRGGRRRKRPERDCRRSGLPRGRPGGRLPALSGTRPKPAGSVVESVQLRQCRNGRQVLVIGHMAGRWGVFAGMQKWADLTLCTQLAVAHTLIVPLRILWPLVANLDALSMTLRRQQSDLRQGPRQVPRFCTASRQE